MGVGIILGKLFYGFENQGRASWQQIMAAINNRLGHSHFGVSGARGNCFSPSGNACEQTRTRFENLTAVVIPDNDPNGIESTIEVLDSITIGSLIVSLNVSHDYASDLEITLAHGDVQVTLWNQESGGETNIQQSFSPTEFDGLDAKGTWTLRASDLAEQDQGTLQSWTLDITQ